MKFTRFFLMFFWTSVSGFCCDVYLVIILNAISVSFCIKKVILSALGRFQNKMSWCNCIYTASVTSLFIYIFEVCKFATEKIWYEMILSTLFPLHQSKVVIISEVAKLPVRSQIWHLTRIEEIFEGGGRGVVNTITSVVCINNQDKKDVSYILLEKSKFW